MICYPLPDISNILNNLGSAKYFSTLDQSIAMGPHDFFSKDS
jgi:hypothetical protein